MVPYWARSQPIELAWVYVKGYDVALNYLEELILPVLVYLLSE